MIQTSKTQAGLPTKLRLHANPAHFRLPHPPSNTVAPPLTARSRPPHLILVPIGQIWMLCTHPTHARLARASSRLRSSAVRRLGTRGWGEGGRGQAESSSVIRSSASCGPGSVGPVGSGLGAGAAVAPSAAGAMEAVPEPSTHAGEAQTAGGASR